MESRIAAEVVHRLHTLPQMFRLLAVLVPAIALGQEPGFGVQTRLVLVPVTVTHVSGAPADGLGKDDFVLLDNGQPRDFAVDTIGTGVAPISLVVAVQTSKISGAVLDKVRRVASMIQPLVTGTRGCAALVYFHSYVRLAQDCTSDPEVLDHAFQQLKPGDPKGARMVDAVDLSLEYLASRPKSRRVLLLISETRDRGSDAELQTVVIKAQSAGVAVYAITYSAFLTGFSSRLSAPDPPRPQVERPKGAETEALSMKGRIPMPPPALRVDVLGALMELVRLNKTKATEALAKATGGNVWFFTRLGALENAIVRLGEELQSQYVLSFTANDKVWGYHNLTVNLRRSDETLQVRARPGYWTMAP